MESLLYLLTTILFTSVLVGSVKTFGSDRRTDVRTDRVPYRTSSKSD